MLKYKILKELKEKYENGLITFKSDYEYAAFALFKKGECCVISQVCQRTYIDEHRYQKLEFSCKVVHDFKIKEVILATFNADVRDEEFVKATFDTLKKDFHFIK